VESGEWRMSSGEWNVENVESGECLVESGKWEWKVESGK
jgi:hypothetical protein